ncbi:hypothetical protein [Wolbachia endosymbiont of Mansonella ozzardi]|uniref:hypothetical protein n=1 Tax=Wolbachia endosymbiont of Mansonella ozzardi TaxID=137464 RepID=UPI001CE1F1A3|nr:hypothetical protein [Wolbachia endosymbiont of Mansonella ozzardi]
MEIDKEKEDGDVLYPEEEYLEDPEEDSKEEDNEKKDINNNGQDKKMVFYNTKFNSRGHDLEKKEDVHLQHNTQMSNKKVDNSSLQTQNNDHLTLKENMEEIKELFERMQSELQHKQQKRASLTVGEL